MGQIYKKIHEYVPRLGKPQGSIVEVGSSRAGDDQSSQYLFDLAKTLELDFVTCDINSEIISVLQQQGIPAVVSKGEEFLSTYDKPISIAYLDNFDWNWHPVRPESWTQVQIDEYKNKYNIEMTNVMSQAAHLLQAIEIERKATPNSIIAFDDTWLFYGWDVYNGKGGSAIPYLVSKGYCVLFTEEYGTILGRFNEKSG